MAFDKRQNQADKPKRIRKRKARTEVSSSSESSDTESSDSSESEKESKATQKVVKRATKRQDKATPLPDADVSSESSPEPATLAIRQQASDDAKAEEAFTSFYLRQMTTEFAEDLDKIRSAGDFNTRSIGMLVDALKQGGSCFGKDERLSVGRSIIMREA